jgi:ABC-type phosphate/phosphonate transport system substrate-binding protein
MCASEREKFVRALLALNQGKDDPVLRLLSAQQFVVANDQEYATTRQIEHDLKMF